MIVIKSTSLLFTVVKYMSEEFCHVNFSTQLFCDAKMKKILVFAFEAYLHVKVQKFR